jgi:hypothetical protein
MRSFSFKLWVPLAIVVLVVSVSGQSRKRGQTAVKPKTVDKQAAAAETSDPAADTPKPKQPAVETVEDRTGKVNKRDTPKQVVTPATPAQTPTYFYEFSRPGFSVSDISIQHDDSGKGTISFKMKGLEETMSDPIQLSQSTLAKINDALTALDFINSTENYQYEKDYSHLGNVKIRVKKDGRERTAAYNWTTNPGAKRLADEYRRISNQFVWEFDLAVARENQPLDAPRLMDDFDSLLRRDEISDPKQMVPLFRELANDERIPLIARNHATKLADRIEKAKK